MTQSFDWSKFETVSPAPNDISNQSQQSFDWSQFEQAGLNPSHASEALRHTARTGSRIAETLAGLPGDILDLPKKIIKYGAEKITGKAQPELDQGSKIAKKLLPFANLPTSSEIREKTKEMSAGYLEPKSEKEEISDEIASDFASLAVPLKTKIPFLKSLGKALGISVGATAASEGASLLGAEQGGKTASKVGTMFLLSAFNPKGANKYVNSLYEEARNLVPKGAKAPAKQLSKQLIDLQSQLNKGGAAASKTKALQKISEIKSTISGGKVPVEELTEFKKSINEMRSGLYEEFKSDKVGRASAKRNLDSVSGIIDNSLAEYGVKNPKWENIYRSANEAHGAIQQSKKMSRAVERMLKGLPGKHWGILAAELFLSPKTAVATSAAYGGLKGVELLIRIVKSPALRKYYMGAVGAAAKQDSAAFSRNMEKLDSELSKNK